MTPTARTTNRLRDEGWLVTTVEQWKRFPDRNKRFCPVCKQQPMLQVRKDLWGFADLLALHVSGAHYLLQVTDNTDHSKRLAKILYDPEVSDWASRVLRTGMKIAVVSWGHQGPRGERKKWTMRWEDVLPGMIPAHADALVEEF